LKDRKKQTVKDFLSGIPNDLDETVENVCCDMYDGYINAVKEIFSAKVNIIIDRFHVAKNYRNAIDSVRKQEMKRLKIDLSDEDYKKLKNVMWLLRKNIMYSVMTIKKH
jgi:transposase